VAGDWKEEIAAALASEDPGAVLELARRQPQRVLRYLTARLYTSDESEKWRVVRALGAVAGAPEVLDQQRISELLRRFVWALNDESGAVPFGVAEAMGEILAARPEFQPAYLPILCSLLTEPEMAQTGAIERGAVWALGRVGPAVAATAPEAVAALARLAQAHPDPETRAVAGRSLKRIIAAGGVPPDAVPE
jgi:hypothetical protein